MEKEKGATATDRAAHHLFDTKEHRMPYPVICPRCNRELNVAYHEERLYTVECPGCETITLAKARNPYEAAAKVGIIARTIEEYHEDYGSVLWWHFPIEEPPEVGTPDSFDRYGTPTVSEYHTHWTPIPIPTRSLWEG